MGIQIQMKISRCLCYQPNECYAVAFGIYVCVCVCLCLYACGSLWVCMSKWVSECYFKARQPAQHVNEKCIQFDPVKPDLLINLDTDYVIEFQF